MKGVQDQMIKAFKSTEAHIPARFSDCTNVLQTFNGFYFHISFSKKKMSFSYKFQALRQKLHEVIDMT